MQQVKRFKTLVGHLATKMPASWQVDRKRIYLKPVLSTLVAMSMVSSAAIPASAQGRVQIVRDAEIETLLKDYTLPILGAAGLSRNGVEIVLVNNQSFNAFVAGRRIFMNTGALMTSETPNEIIGVIAHEAGHLAGGHQQRLREQISRARTLSIVGTLLGVGAVAAGSAVGADGAAQAGTGIAVSSGTTANRLLLSYRRSEEMNADQAAVKYLNATKQSAAGMLRTFERFSQGLALAGVRANPYELSHPLPRERIALLEELARQSPYFDRNDPESLVFRHNMMRAKIAAFSGGHPAVARLFRNDPRGLPARYGAAIATDLSGRSDSGLSQIDSLIRELPNNPYLYEMKGEMLLKLRRPGEAADAFARALRLDKANSGLIRARLGFALLSTGERNNMDRAISELRASISNDPDNLVAYRQLSQAYGIKGDVASAELTIAEGHFRAGNKREAQVFAARAQQKMQKGTPGWQRANDILTVGQ